MTGYDREVRFTPPNPRRVAVAVIIALALIAAAFVAKAGDVYTLAFSACTDAQHCERHEVGVDSCLAAGLPYLARWASEHPGWSVTHWTCAVGVPS